MTQTPFEQCNCSLDYVDPKIWYLFLDSFNHATCVGFLSHLEVKCLDLVCLEYLNG